VPGESYCNEGLLIKSCGNKSAWEYVQPGYYDGFCDYSGQEKAIKQCGEENKKVQICEKADENGECSAWRNNETCEEGYFCYEGACKCIQKNCTQLGKQCGNWDNGCGTELNCGICGQGSICNSTGQCSIFDNCTINNQKCSDDRVGYYTCVKERGGKGLWGNFFQCTDSQVCSEKMNTDNLPEAYCKDCGNCSTLGKECGIINDTCNRILNCGSCLGQNQCINNTCVLEEGLLIDCEDKCTKNEKMCSLSGKSYFICKKGSNNNCLEWRDEVSCGENQICDGGVCKCIQKNCTQLGKQCGNWDNGCGVELDCGSIYSKDEDGKELVCNGNGEYEPTSECFDTCESLGYYCDNHTICGKEILCGTCELGSFCKEGICNKYCIDDDINNNLSFFGRCNSIQTGLQEDRCDSNSGKLEQFSCQSVPYIAGQICVSNLFSCLNDQVCNNGECCMPKNCMQLGKQCGKWDNGCDIELDCGPLNITRINEEGKSIISLCDNGIYTSEENCEDKTCEDLDYECGNTVVCGKNKICGTCSFNGQECFENKCIFHFSEQKMRQGFSTQIPIDLIIPFNITLSNLEKQTHEIKVLRIATDSVRLEIFSDTIILDIFINEEKGIDFDGDKKDDLSIKLISITDGKADLFIKQIFYELPAPPANAPPSSNGGGSNSGGGGGSSCTPKWNCTAWSDSTCGTRICIDKKSCGVLVGKPTELKSCNSTSYCGDGVCNDDESCGELNSGSPECNSDCGFCVIKLPTCGNGKCDGPETSFNCPEDCKTVSSKNKKIFFIGLIVLLAFGIGYISFLIYKKISKKKLLAKQQIPPSQNPFFKQNSPVTLQY